MVVKLDITTLGAFSISKALNSKNSAIESIPVCTSHLVYKKVFFLTFDRLRSLLHLLAKLVLVFLLKYL